MRDLLLDLMGHMRWADGLFADVLERMTPDPETARLYAHVASVEHVWYSRIQGRPADHAIWPSLSVSQARALAVEHADLFERLIKDGDDDALTRRVNYRNSAGRQYESAVAQIVTHVSLHGTHHRGQIARLIRTSGGEPPYTDYIQYTRRDQTG